MAELFRLVKCYNLPRLMHLSAADPVTMARVARATAGACNRQVHMRDAVFPGWQNQKSINQLVNVKSKISQRC
jgi:hypothetical protein